MIFCTKIQVRNTISTKNEKMKTVDCASERSSIANIFRFISIFDARHSRQTDVFDFFEKVKSYWPELSFWTKNCKFSKFWKKVIILDDFEENTSTVRLPKKWKCWKYRFWTSRFSTSWSKKGGLIPNIIQGGCFFLSTSKISTNILVISLRWLISTPPTSPSDKNDSHMFLTLTYA